MTSDLCGPFLMYKMQSDALRHPLTQKTIKCPLGVFLANKTCSNALGFPSSTQKDTFYLQGQFPDMG